ncbi:unnamed protein product [Echinostoma caproni]|uniref:Uncharacterized protein n=1 Tax=Echinostoma caproni TaxID=27848 RepID=A0A183B5A6_9TREM|nr:unnamed protein product [Echinostoma caproni]
MEGGTKRAPASKTIKNEAHPNIRADVAAGRTSRDNVDYHPKRTKGQLQPERPFAASQKDIHRMPQRRSCRSTYPAPKSDQTSRDDTRKKRRRACQVRTKTGIDQEKEARIILPHG